MCLRLRKSGTGFKNKIKNLKLRERELKEGEGNGRKEERKEIGKEGYRGRAKVKRKDHRIRRGMEGAWENHGRGMGGV